MSLSAQQIRQVLSSARQVQFDAPAESVEEFVSRVLDLSPVERNEYFPGPDDPKDVLAIAVSSLTKERQDVLQNKCAVPSFAVYKDVFSVFQIAGLSTYLETKAIGANLRLKLTQHEQIRTALRRLENGHHLEALAAAIMNASCNYGEATQGSGDQGIDAIGWKELLLIDFAFSNGDVTPTGILPGEKVFLFASSKAMTMAGSNNRSPKLLDPAHIRELIGGWIIQRTSKGMWQRDVGIRMLSPVQMILVTTYRLSTAAKALCFELGVQVWGIPELIYLVCRWAPESVFDPDNAYLFLASEFRSWWKERDERRIGPRLD